MHKPLVAELTQPSIRVFDCWPHQLEAYHAAYGRLAFMGDICMGGGKSKLACDLNQNSDAKSILILCPPSVLSVWRRELAKHLVDELPTLILDASKGSVKQKTRLAEDHCKRFAHRPHAVCINYESAWREPFGKWALSRRWDVCIADEIHRIKSPTGKASKWAGKLSGRCGRRVGLTGTMLPHSPLDVFGEYRFLDPSIFGRWYTKFRARYAVTDRMFPSQVRQWINQDELHEKIYTIAHRVTLEDANLGLPEVMHETRTCRMNPKAVSVYRELRDELIVQVAQGVVRADNALVKTLRLRQITSGFVTNDLDETVDLDTSKAAALEDMLDDLPQSEPVVVFCEFRHDLQTVERLAEKTRRRYGELSGCRKDGITDHATMNPDIDLLGVQYQSGGVGIDLTRAAYCVMYSPTYNLGNFDQAIARLHRPGQERVTRFYRLVCDDTIDEIVYQALDARRNVIEAVLSGLLEEHRL